MLPSCCDHGLSCVDAVRQYTRKNHSEEEEEEEEDD